MQIYHKSVDYSIIECKETKVTGVLRGIINLNVKYFFVPIFKPLNDFSIKEENLDSN